MITILLKNSKSFSISKKLSMLFFQTINDFMLDGYIDLSSAPVDPEIFSILIDKKIPPQINDNTTMLEVLKTSVFLGDIRIYNFLGRAVELIIDKKISISDLKDYNNDIISMIFDYFYEYHYIEYKRFLIDFLETDRDFLNGLATIHKYYSL